MITKFHKLIQSRILWISILVIIVFSFVIWGMVWPSDIEKMERANAAGLLKDDVVTHAEYRAAYLTAYLSRALALGRDAAQTAESEDALRQLTWLRIASLREAKQLGIHVSDEELITAIRGSFTDNQGHYHPEQYTLFRQNTLAAMGFSGGQFEEYVRQEIIIQKLAFLIGQQARVSPAEVRRTFDTLMDSFVVEYAPVRLADVEAAVQISNDDVQAYYDEHTETFRTPERRRVLVAAFPIADFADADAEFSDDDIQAYYELHIQDYTSETETEDGETRQEVADLDDVRDSIAGALQREAATLRADEAATELTFRSTPDRDGTIPDFQEQAEAAGYPATETPPFSLYEFPILDGGFALTEAAFNLEMDAFDRVSIPVMGEENIYVLYLAEIQEPHIPELDAVRDDVHAAAMRQAVNQALADQANAIRDAALAGIEAGKSFAESVQDLAGAVKTTDPFTGMDAANSEDTTISALAHAVVTHNPGEVTEPVPHPEGALVAYIVSRTPGDADQFISFRDEITRALQNQRAQTLFSQWQRNLLAAGNFTDYLRGELIDDDDDDETESDNLEED